MTKWGVYLKLKSIIKNKWEFNQKSSFSILDNFFNVFSIFLDKSEVFSILLVISKGKVQVLLIREIGLFFRRQL